MIRRYARLHWTIHLALNGALTFAAALAAGSFDPIAGAIAAAVTAVALRAIEHTIQQQELEALRREATREPTISEMRRQMAREDSLRRAMER